MSWLFLPVFLQKRKANKKLNKTLKTVNLQKTEIELQRDEITEQHKIVITQKKHITDSILYAKRIQEAILPNSQLFDKYFSDHFIFFKPLDVVSGDFYWIKDVAIKTEFGLEYLTFIAVADCTGHGVPGAFVSMLGISFLNELISVHP